MKKFLSSRGLFAIGFIVLLATNIAVFYGVISNRSGEPEACLTLTERELRLPSWANKENSGLSLRLVWRTLGKNGDYGGYVYRGCPAWFDAEKLKELGFDPIDYSDSENDKDFYKKPIPKEVFIVLENKGAPYREAVKRAEEALKREENLLKLSGEDKRLRDNFERAERRLKDELSTESRLFAIDAGLDPAALRKKYEDRKHVIIAKGLVRPEYNYAGKKKEISGYISGLSVGNIHVSLKHKKVFEAFLEQKKPGFESHRYEADLAYGNRLEPWIVSVRPLRGASD
jgi:hypothetical protein